VVNFVVELILPFWQSKYATAKMAERARSPHADFQCAHHEHSHNPQENLHDLISPRSKLSRKPDGFPFSIISSTLHFTRTQKRRSDESAPIWKREKK
jgi:hypothetical protein